MKKALGSLFDWLVAYDDKENKTLFINPFILGVICLLMGYGLFSAVDLFQSSLVKTLMVIVGILAFILAVNYFMRFLIQLSVPPYYFFKKKLSSYPRVKKQESKPRKETIDYGSFKGLDNLERAITGLSRDLRMNKKPTPSKNEKREWSKCHLGPRAISKELKESVKMMKELLEKLKLDKELQTEISGDYIKFLCRDTMGGIDKAIAIPAYAYIACKKGGLKVTSSKIASYSKIRKEKLLNASKLIEKRYDSFRGKTKRF